MKINVGLACPPISSITRDATILEGFPVRPPCLVVLLVTVLANVPTVPMVNNGVMVGFRRVDGKCAIGSHNCAKYDDNGKCADCKNDYSLVLGHCRHNFLLGCRLEEADHTCKDCFSPFTMNGNHCYIPKCKTYNDYGCVGCECGYYLTADRSCK